VNGVPPDIMRIRRRAGTSHNALNVLETTKPQSQPTQNREHHPNTIEGDKKFKEEKKRTRE